jgi:frataxin
MQRAMLSRLVGCRAPAMLAHAYGAAAAARRGVSHDLGMQGFNDIAYNTHADKFIDQVMTTVDALDCEAVEDVELSDNVLNIDTARGKFVLNKQAPMMQLWLSSPVSGPHHYNMVAPAAAAAAAAAGAGGDEAAAAWQSDRDAHDLKQKLQRELSEVLAKDVTFDW